MALYIKEDITYKIRHDLYHNTEDFESRFIEIVNTTSGNMIVGTVYIPPDASCSNVND